MKTNRKLSFAVMLAALSAPGFCGPALAVDVTGPSVGWRMDGTGRYPNADPPLRWAPDQNVLWATPTTAGSNCTPVIWGDRIFITAEEADLICIHKADGRILWQASNDYDDFMSAQDLARVDEAKRVDEQLGELNAKRGEIDGELNKLERAEKTDESKVAVLKNQRTDLDNQIAELTEALEALAAFVKPRPHKSNGYATATPVTDGQRVCAVFGTGVAACYDLDGNRQWIRKIATPGPGHGHSASPLLIENMLLVHMNEVIALQAQTGVQLWRTAAPVHFGTPVLAAVGGEHVLITPHGDFIRVRDGANLGVVSSHVANNSPVVHDGVVYFFGTHDDKVLAVELPQRAEPFTPKMLWTTERVKKYGFGSPARHEDLLYGLDIDNRFRAIDAGTGEVIYNEQVRGLGGPMYPSVTIAGGHLFLGSENGSALVLEPGREYKVIATNKLDDLVRCSPVFEGTRMYVRGHKNVYCIGK